MFYAYKLSLTKLHVIYKVPNIRERHYENTFEDRGLQCYSGVLNHSSLLTNIVINILMNPSNNFILKKYLNYLNIIDCIYLFYMVP